MIIDFMVDSKRKIFCLMGPTAIGKTDFAIELTKRFPFEIISVDSAMIYRGLDIGTAKPKAEQLQASPHFLIDICDPREFYSVGQFRHDALQKIQEIFDRGYIPLLVGGTMLYFHVLQQGISNLPKSDERVRLKINAEKDEMGLNALYRRLQKIDYKIAENISHKDTQRIQRALEVFDSTGKSLSELRAISPPYKLPYEIINIIVVPLDMDLLRQKIKKRFDRMLALGFIDEVKQLYNRKDLHPNLPSIRTVGYRQIWQYLSGDLSYERMLELVPIATNQLAKRQLTWLKKWHNAMWFNDNDTISSISKAISSKLKLYGKT